jgi:hypothetical protein
MMRRQRALAVAEWARTHVPLYRALYGDTPITSWTMFRRLPVLTSERWRSTPLGEQIDEPHDTLRTFTPLALQTVAPLAATVADAGDTDTIYEQWHDALAAAGIEDSARLMLLSPPEQRYFAAEVADMLGFFGVAAHLVSRMEDGRALAVAAALDPTAIVTVATVAPAPLMPRVTMREPSGPAADIYVVPEAGPVAVRPRGDTGYYVLDRMFMVEGGRDGVLLLTALRRYHQPLIRYALPDRGRLAAGRLWLDEVAR